MWPCTYFCVSTEILLCPGCVPLSSAGRAHLKELAARRREETSWSWSQPDYRHPHHPRGLLWAHLHTQLGAWGRRCLPSWDFMVVGGMPQGKDRLSDKLGWDLVTCSPCLSFTKREKRCYFLKFRIIAYLESSSNLEQTSLIAGWELVVIQERWISHAQTANFLSLLYWKQACPLALFNFPKYK